MDKVALDKIQSFLQSNPSLQGLEQEQLVSILVEKGIVTAKELEEISAFYASQMDSGMGLQLQSNRKIDDVLKRGKNSNEILFKSNDGKNYNLNKTIQNKLNKLTQDLKKSEDSQGWIGSSWSWAKNTFNFGDSSNKVREARKKEQELLKKFNLDNPNIGQVFQELTGVEFTPDNLEKFIKGEIKLKSEQALVGYDEGQDMASDMGGDIISGIGAMLVYSAAVAAAPVTGGASIALGFGLATVAGGGIKCGIKASDKGYCTKKDFVTGAFSGALAPLTGGLGGAVGKSVAKATGIQAVKAMAKEGAEQTVKTGAKSWLKTALINPAGYEYGIQVAGKEGLKMGWKGAAALGAEMATDGALGGAIDTAFRTGYEQVEENGELDWGVIGESALQGGIGGAALAPVIGGGMKATGKIGHKIGEKLHLTNGSKAVADEVAEEVSEQTSKQISNTTDDFVNRLNKANSREDFVAIRDEIKQLPQGEEKTKLIQEYTKKYSEWSGKPQNSHIEAHYKPNELELEKVNSLKAKFADKPNIQRNIERLFLEGLPASHIADMARFLDIPEDIVNSYIRLWTKNGDNISPSILHLFAGLCDSNQVLKSNYKEIVDLTTDLFSKKVGDKELNGLQVAGILHYSNHSKATIDNMLQVLNLKGVKTESISDMKYVEKLSKLLESDSNATRKIEDVLTLTPSQLESRGGKPLSIDFASELLDGSKYNEKQISAVKDLATSGSLKNAKANDIINLANRFNFEEKSLAIVKQFSEFCDEDINTIGYVLQLREKDIAENLDILRILFNKKAQAQENRLFRTHNIIDLKTEELNNIRTYLELIKENDDLLNNIRLDLISDGTNIKFLKNIIKKDKKIKFENLLQELKKAQIVDLTKNITNPKLKELAFKLEMIGYPSSKSLIESLEDISLKLDNVNDSYLNTTIKNMIDSCNEAVEKGDISFSYAHIIDKIDSYLDVYHTFNSHYEYIGSRYDKTKKRVFWDYIKGRDEHKDFVSKSKNMFSDKKIREYSATSDTDGLLRDFAEEGKIDRLRDFCINHKDDPMSDYFYNEYYLKDVNIPRDLATICADINKEFNVKVFLSHSEFEKSLGELHYLHRELSEWKAKSNGTAKYPQVLDLTKINKDYIDKTSAYGQSASGGAQFPDGHIEINGYEIAYAMRHEMTHANELGDKVGIGTKYIIDEIMPHKIENGVEIPDFENCKFREEFLNAGIDPEHIDYAYNNTQEFIAVASEGDMSKYSPEFKQMLMDFGMPEWQFDMQVLNPKVLENIEKLEVAKAKHGKNADFNTLYDALVSPYNAKRKSYIMAFSEIAPEDAPFDVELLIKCLKNMSDSDIATAVKDNDNMSVFIKDMEFIKEFYKGKLNDEDLFDNLSTYRQIKDLVELAQAEFAVDKFEYNPQKIYERLSNIADTMTGDELTAFCHDLGNIRKLARETANYKSKLNEKQLAAYNKHIKDIKSDLEKSLIPEQLENANKILELLEDHVLRFEPRSYTACTLRITSSDISAMAQIPNLNMQRLEFLVKNLSDKEPQGIGHILNRIMKMSDNDFDTISKFLGDKKNDVGLLYSLSGIDIKNIDRIQYYISQLGYGNKTNSADFSTLFTQISSMTEEQWNRVISRDLLKRLSSETKYNLHHSLLTLADLDDKAWNIALKRKLINNKSLYYIKTLTDLSDDEFNKLISLKLFDPETGMLKCGGNFVNDFLSLTPQQEEKLIKFDLLKRGISNEDYSGGIINMENSAAIIQMLNAPEEEFQKLINKNLFNIEIEGRKLNIEELCTLGDVESNVINKVINEIMPLTPNMKIKEALALSELSSADITKIKKFNLFEETVAPRLFSSDVDGSIVMMLSAFRQSKKGVKEPVKLRPAEIVQIAKQPEEVIPNLLRILKNENVEKFAFEDLVKVSKLDDSDFIKAEKLINEFKDDNHNLMSAVIKEVDNKMIFDDVAYSQILKLNKILDDSAYACTFLAKCTNADGSTNNIAAEKMVKLIEETYNSDLILSILDLSKANIKEEFDMGFLNALEEAQKRGLSLDHVGLILKECTDVNGYFDKNIYKKIDELRSANLFEAVIPQIFKACKNSDGTFNNEVYRTAFKLNEMGYGRQDIGFILQASRDLDGNFSPKLMDRIKNEIHLWSINDFPTVVKSCLKKNGDFDEVTYSNLIKLRNSGKLTISNIVDIIPVMNTFREFFGKTNINELTIAEKRSLLKDLIQSNSMLFDDRVAIAKKVLGLESLLIPTNKEEYCALLPKLVKSIGIDTKPLSKEIKENYYRVMNSLAKPDGALARTDFSKGLNVELKYPRERFITEINEMLSSLSPIERNKAMDYFGFELINRSDGIVQMNGYPINVNNGAKMAEITDPATRSVIEKMRPLVESFTNKNQIIIKDNPALAKELNDIVKAFPEFLTTIGRRQHGTHDFTIDVHTLKVLQGVVTNPRYQKLSEADRKILQLATLMHDLTKAENLVDKSHPQYSAYDAYYILEKMDLSESDKLKIYQLIKNHDWLERFNKAGTNQNDVARDIAFNLREGNLFEMASILTEADLKGVKKTDAFFQRFKGALDNGNETIKKLVDEIKKTSIYLPQTKIPKASQLKIDGDRIKVEVTKDAKGNPISNTVLYLDKDMDLSQYGFASGLNSNDLNVLVHALDYENQSAIFQALGQVDSDALLSSSYITYRKGNYHVFRTQGFVLDVANTDIHAGTYKDFGSGYGKDLHTLKTQYLFNGERKEIRNYFSDKFKKMLNLSDEEYLKLYDEIFDKTITELDETHPEVAIKIRELFDEMEVHKRSHGRDYNEILISRPKIQAVFWQGKIKDADASKGLSKSYSLDRVPEFLRKYAADNDLPIIYFGK